MSWQTPENLGHQRAYVNEPQVQNWFRDLANFLEEEHGINAVEFLSPANASHIFNVDESGFPLSGTNGKLKIITAKGAKNVYQFFLPFCSKQSTLGPFPKGAKNVYQFFLPFYSKQSTLGPFPIMLFMDGHAYHPNFLVALNENACGESKLPR